MHKNRILLVDDEVRILEVYNVLLPRQGGTALGGGAGHRPAPQKGVKILRPLKQYEHILPGILHHHERYDGSGYPAGPAGRPDPAARADHRRRRYVRRHHLNPPLPKGNSHAETLEELKRFAGRQFDPRIVGAFVKADQRLQHDRAMTPLGKESRFRTAIPLFRKPLTPTRSYFIIILI